MVELNTGQIPDNDRRYEDLEVMLGRFYVSLLPLKDGDARDQAHFNTAVSCLNGIARSRGIQLPEEAIVQPRTTLEEAGATAAFSSASSLIESLDSLYHEFGIGMQPRTPEFVQKFQLATTISSVLVRHGVIRAEFEDMEGEPEPVRVRKYSSDSLQLSLEEVFAPAA